jgi:hypothetical protein
MIIMLYKRALWKGKEVITFLMQIAWGNIKLKYEIVSFDRQN